MREVGVLYAYQLILDVLFMDKFSHMAYNA